MEEGRASPPRFTTNLTNWAPDPSSSLIDGPSHFNLLQPSALLCPHLLSLFPDSTPNIYLS